MAETADTPTPEPAQRGGWARLILGTVIVGSLAGFGTEPAARQALSLVIGGCLLGWLALEWSGPSSAGRFVPLLIVGGIAAVRVWPVLRLVGIDFFFGDEGTVLTVGRQLLDGHALYREQFEFLWPGSFVLTAALFKVFGVHLLSIHIALTVLLAGSVVLMFLCVRQVADTGWALVAVLWSLTAFAPQAVWWSPYWMSTASGLLATWLLVRSAPKITQRMALLSGMAAGLTLCFQQHKGFALIAALGLAIVLTGITAPRDAARRLTAYVTGVALLVLPVVGWYAMSGAFVDFKYATWDWLREGYAPANATSLELLPIDFSHPPFVLAQALWSEGSHTVAHLAPFAFVFGGLLLLAPEPRPGWRAQWLILLAGCSAIFVAALLRYQYLRLVYVAPATCLIAAGLLGRAAAFGNNPYWRWGVQGSVGLLSVTMALHAWGAHLRDLARRPQIALAETAVGPVQLVSLGLRYTPDTVDALRFLSALPSEASVAAYPSGGGYALLTGRKIPWKYCLLIPGYNRPHQVQDAIASLDAAPVEYFLWDRFYTPEWVEHVLPSLPRTIFEDNDLMTYVREHYQPVLTLDTITVYRRRPALPNAA